MVAMGEKEVMQTALMPVRCHDQFYETRAQFDTGSTRTYVTKELVKVLKAKPIKQPSQFIRLQVLKQNKKRHQW